MTRKPKSRMGRPPLGDHGHSVSLAIKVTRAQRTLWLEAASRESMTMSAWLRAAADRAIARGSTR